MGLFKRFLLFSCTLLALTAFFTQAYAAPAAVYPEPTVTIDSDPQQSASLIDSGNFDEWKTNDFGVLVWKYNKDPDPSGYNIEQGLPLTNSYYVDTLVYDDDLTGATINHNSGTNTVWDYTDENGDAYNYATLVIKDGNNVTPVWYQFDLTIWDGYDDVILAGFWPGDGGGISNFGLYLTNDELPNINPVPVPSSAYLLGSALLLLPAVLRRKQTRN